MLFWGRILSYESIVNVIRPAGNNVSLERNLGMILNRLGQLERKIFFRNRLRCNVRFKPWGRSEFYDDYLFIAIVRLIESTGNC